MTHRENSRAFSRRYGRCFWKRAAQFSSADKPTPEGLASAGTSNVGSVEGSTSAASANEASAGSQSEQRGSHEVGNQQRPSPPPTHSAGGGVCCLMFAAQVHADRWAMLAVIGIFLGAFAIAIIRANRPSHPTTPPRGRSGGPGSTNTED